MAIDFSLLGQGPQFGNILAAYDAGRQQRKQADTQNALALYATNPEEGIKAVTKVDPVLGIKLQDDFAARKTAAERKAVFQEADPEKRRSAAVATGDPDVIGAVSKLDDEQRKRVKEVNETLAGIAFGLRKRPYEERKGLIQQMAPDLERLGISQDRIAAVDPTDGYLDSQIMQAQTLDKQIDQLNKDRDFDLKKTDTEADNKRADLTAEEARRHNRVSEGQGAQRLGLEGQRLGLERQRVEIARQEAGNKASGALTPVQARKTETDLRKEFDGLPEVKSYRTVAQSAKTVQQLASASPSAQGDIALTYATMKAYDPTSVVRESEFATAQNAAGVPDRIRNAYNRALKGERLTPKQRAEMAAAVNSVAKSAQERYNQIEGQYRTYAQDYGANPERVAPRATSASRPDPLGIR